MLLGRIFRASQSVDVTESGAFPPPPPPKPFPWGTIIVVLVGSKVVYDLMSFKEDWDKLTNKEVDTELWNQYVAPTYQTMLHQNIFTEALGQGAREVGPIEQVSKPGFQTFQDGMLFTVKGEKELRIPLSGPKGSGEFVFVAEWDHQRWSKGHAFLETPTACYLETGEKITRE